MTALDDVISARNHLHDSTYWAAAQRAKGSNKLWLTDLDLAKAIADLQPAPPPPPVAFPTPPQGALVAHDGQGQQAQFLFLYAPDALTPQNIGGLDIRNFRRYGLGVMSWNPDLPNAVAHEIHDLRVSGIHEPTIGSDDGTAEVGLWIGQKANVSRVQFGPGSFIDLWTGSHCDGSHFADLDFTHPEHVAIYHEHVTVNTLVERFRIGQGTAGQANPVNVEWTYGGVGSSKIVWRDFDIYCPAGKTGIFLDAGTWGCTIGAGRFWGPGDAIGLPNHLAGPTDNTVDPGIVFENAGRHVYRHDNAIG